MSFPIQIMLSTKSSDTHFRALQDIICCIMQEISARVIPTFHTSPIWVSRRTFGDSNVHQNSRTESNLKRGSWCGCHQTLIGPLDSTLSIVKVNVNVTNESNSSSHRQTTSCCFAYLFIFFKVFGSFRTVQKKDIQVNFQPLCSGVCPQLLASLSFATLTFSFTTYNALVNYGSLNSLNIGCTHYYWVGLKA